MDEDSVEGESEGETEQADPNGRPSVSQGVKATRQNLLARHRGHARAVKEQCQRRRLRIRRRPSPILEKQSDQRLAQNRHEHSGWDGQQQNRPQPVDGLTAQFAQRFLRRQSGKGREQGNAHAGAEEGDRKLHDAIRHFHCRRRPVRKEGTETAGQDDGVDLGDGKAEDDRDDQLEDLPCPFVAPVKARAKIHPDLPEFARLHQTRTDGSPRQCAYCHPFNPFAQPLAAPMRPNDAAEKDAQVVKHRLHLRFGEVAQGNQSAREQAAQDEKELRWQQNADEADGEGEFAFVADHAREKQGNELRGKPLKEDDEGEEGDAEVSHQHAESFDGFFVLALRQVAREDRDETRRQSAA